jgi:hypothetical protein
MLSRETFNDSAGFALPSKIPAGRGIVLDP